MIHHFIDVGELEPSRGVAHSHAAVVVQQRLQVLKHIDGAAGQAEVKRPQEPEILEIVVFDEFYYNILIWLDLEHLQHQADELRGLLRLAKHPAHEPQLHPLVDNAFSRQAEAVLFPVQRVIYLLANDVLDQILQKKESRAVIRKELEGCAVTQYIFRFSLAFQFSSIFMLFT